MASAGENNGVGGQGEESTTAPSNELQVPGHVPMADRISLQSWGTGSGPSLPDIDSEVGYLSDSDSDFRSNKFSTTSVQSSIYHSVEEHGRTYHRFREGKYPLPNDQQEQDRLDLQHAMFVITTHGKLHLAPIGNNPKNILDIATGTGVWAIEMAQLYPNAEVTGTDLSPIQPEYIPANCQFEIDDAEEEWLFSKKFDYIHGRALLSCFRDPLYVIQQAYDSLAPGGWLEFQDGTFPMEYVDGPPPENCAIKKWNDLLIAGAEKAGRPWTNTKHYKRWFEEVGLEEVVQREFYWPITPWAKGKYYKTLGAFCQEDMLRGVEGMSLKVIGQLGWSAEKIREFIPEVQAELRDTKVHVYTKIRFVYGRKPLSAK
ncbi:S-adenosyl-L-methionine-dependent methyltransferase [Rhypophila decipiens]|uniref:S-adenosyl-L-methionine-dependent methyltransferase n=1 Tax=Rhypophila decipiens TaxID=261697 RepID=A0AAN6XYR0_9PEZI|nr:S-adenosyl-L-methionine-dependent methyltransferase [Rhypophila decipiens]